MSLIFMDGFDDGLHALKWAAIYAITSPGRTGSGAMHLDYNGQPLSRKVFDTSVTTPISIGFAYRGSNGPGGAGFSSSQDFFGIGLGIIPFVNTGAPHFYMKSTTNNGLEVGRGGMWGIGAAKTTLGTTANNVLTPNVWQYIEVKLTVHSSTGAILVRINGDTKLNLTGLNTQIGGSALVDCIAFSASFPGWYMAFDDLYVCDSSGSVNNDLLGDCAIETLYPNGNGNYSQFTGSDSNSTDNYLLVDEATPSTTDYVGSLTEGNKDTYAYGNLALTSGSVKAVAVRNYAAKSDVGDKSISTVVRSGGSDSIQSAKNLGTGYTVYTDILEQNPVGSTAWTISSVNAAEFGVQVEP